MAEEKKGQTPNQEKKPAGEGTFAKSNVAGAQRTADHERRGGNLAQRGVKQEDTLEGDPNDTRGRQLLSPGGQNLMEKRIDDSRLVIDGKAIKAKTPKGHVRFRSNPQTGDMITPSKNAGSEGWCSIGVYQNTETFNNGIRRVQTRTALIKFPDEAEAKAFIMDNAVKEDSLFPGKITEKQSFEPFWPGQTEVLYPATSPFAGQQVLKDGKPYYRSTQYTDNLAEVDVILPGANTAGSMVGLRQTIEEGALEGAE